MADDRTEADERLMQWLRDAHAMETQAETMLTGMENRIEHYPHLRKRIAQHLKETQHQSQRLEDAITRLGGSTSTIKDSVASLTTMAQGLLGSIAGDEVMKGLIAAASTLGDVETTRICRESLREEEDMAQWLSTNIDQLTAEYLEREERGSVSAKR